MQTGTVQEASAGQQVRIMKQTNSKPIPCLGLAQTSNHLALTGRLHR
jgi:hypothetical protein